MNKKTETKPTEKKELTPAQQLMRLLNKETVLVKRAEKSKADLISVQSEINNLLEKRKQQNDSALNQ